MRKANKRSTRCNIAIIVDGMDEKWYIENVKCNYPCSKLKQIKIKPNLPEKKTIDELFKDAEKKAVDYDYVVLIIDLDEPLQPNKVSEFKKFREWYNKYIVVKNSHQSIRRCKWMEKLRVIINNPCLEFWYLLHANKTTKFYSNYDVLKKDLVKIENFETYEKSEDYYNRYPNIYVRLNKIDNNKGLSNARKNAKPFCIESCGQESGSEMNLLFDFFDQL